MPVFDENTSQSYRDSKLEIKQDLQFKSNRLLPP